MKAPLALLFFLFSGLIISHAQPKFDTTGWVLYLVGKDTLYIRKDTPFDIAVKSGEYKKAVGLMKATLKSDPNNATNNYNLSCIYALIHNPDSAIFFLSLSLLKDSSVFALSDPDMYSIITDPRWKKIKEAQIAKYELKNGKLINRNLSEELWTMFMKDQAFYRPSKLLENKFGPQKNLQDSLTKIYQPLWDSNLKELKKIIRKNGWPMISVVGKKAALTAFLIVQHGDYESQKKYEPIMEAAANKGEADWSELALLIDRIRIHENKPQLYGSQVKFNEKTKQYEPEPIEDETNLDIRRSKVGLGSAANYYSNWKIKYTVKQNKE